MNLQGPWPPRLSVHIGGRRRRGERSARWQVELAVTLIRVALIGMAVIVALLVPTAAPGVKGWLAVTAALLAVPAFIPVDISEDEPD